MQVTSLVEHNLLTDVISLLNKETGTAHLVVRFGADVCGHVRVVHGGIMSILCDEVLTAATSGLQRGRLLGSGPAVCETLTVNFRKVCVRTLSAFNFVGTVGVTVHS
jgi:acyl-coenzyme A thioesterase PaaI-like protein